MDPILRQDRPQECLPVLRRREYSLVGDSTDVTNTCVAYLGSAR